MPNLIQKFERSFSTQLLGNLFFLHILKNFSHTILQSARKLNPKFFPKKDFANKLVSFYNLNTVANSNIKLTEI